MSSSYATKYRTHTFAELRELEPDAAVTLCGWFPGRPGDALAFDLVDRYGRVHVLVPEAQPVLHELVRSLQAGDVLQVSGRISRLPEGGSEPVDITAIHVVRLSRSDRLPIDVYGDPATQARETPLEFRLKYRYLDLRRPEMQRRLEMRSNLFFEARSFLRSSGFLEVDTPALTRWTQDATTAYIVAANQGGAFALSQSPQFYKQMLMIGGCDRYFQLARCYRNEPELTPDRQPEFASLDLEMSYVDQEDVLQNVDALMGHIWGALLGVELVSPIPRLTYEEAMLTYGTDRPDLRFGMEIHDITELANQSRTAAFRLATQAPPKPGGAVRAMAVPGDSLVDYSPEQIDALLKANPDPARVQISWAKLEAPNRLSGPLSDAFAEPAILQLGERLSAWPGDVILVFSSRNRHALAPVAGRLRSYLGHALGLIDTSIHALTWVTDYPYFGYDPGGDCFMPLRHPFTRPHDEDLKYLERVGPMKPGRDPDDGNTEGAPVDQWFIRIGDLEREPLLKIRTQSYELIMNGEELATGSIRIHDPALQEKIFSMFGYDREVATRRFYFMLEALRYGAPPHGGIAVGVERLLARLQGLDDIGEVMAFPKNSGGACMVTGAPSPIDPNFLEALLGL